ncbi:MAG: PqqD family protein [bacterium]|nr:PqqD family protein [bacterium]
MIPIKKNKLAERIIDGEAFVLAMEDSKFHTLNEVGSRIFELCDGKNSTERIVDIIYSEYEGDKDGIQRDVLSFIQHLESKNLIDLKEG